MNTTRDHLLALGAGFAALWTAVGFIAGWESWTTPFWLYVALAAVIYVVDAVRRR